MKKAMGMAVAVAVAAITLGSGPVFAQDGATGPVVSLSGVSGLNLQVGAAARKDDLLAGTEKFAQGASKVAEINLDPTTMAMIGDHGPDGRMAGKMKLMVVRSYQYDKPGMYRMEDVDAYVKKLEDGSWSCPVVSREKVKDAEKLSYICAKTDSDHETNEMVILSAEPQKIAFIHMAGTMSFNDLTHMQDSTRGLNIHGGGPWSDPRPFREPNVKVAPPAPATPAVPAQH
ncbi:MAG TPA: DUF4252 domain-containing protein [Acidobacteriaceae bacterium]|nr:DUF4252 domain-containing protein [Acidobacteriaceae bacterium]